MNTLLPTTSSLDNCINYCTMQGLTVINAHSTNNSSIIQVKFKEFCANTDFISRLHAIAVYKNSIIFTFKKVH
jgi:hypothetical protein